MLIPVRCFTCGNVVADKYTEYFKKVRQGEESSKVLDDLGVKRYCCRRMIISNVEVFDQAVPYYEVLHRRRQEYSPGEL